MKPHDFIDGDLIPGLPNEVSEVCLLHLPFPCFALLRSVSPLWNRALSNPSFFATKSNLFLTKPYLLAFATDLVHCKIQWQCLDLVSKNWFPLPPMPIPDDNMGELAPMACSVDKEKGEMYVFRRDSKNYVMVYSAATNSWRIGKGSMKLMKRENCVFTSAAIGGKVFAFAGEDGGIGDDGAIQVRCYDPVLDSCVNMAEMTCTINSYDAAVIGKKIFITEGWIWPFDVIPNGSIYDAELNTWQSMPVGMREGWTGSAATVGPNLFVLSETGDRKAKVYDHVSDKWMQVGGSGIPELVKKPYTVTGDENGKIYVVGRGVNVAIGTLIEIRRKEWEIEWEVVKGLDAFSGFEPCCSQILYA